MIQGDGPLQLPTKSIMLPWAERSHDDHGGGLDRQGLTLYIIQLLFVLKLLVRINTDLEVRSTLYVSFPIIT